MAAELQNPASSGVQRVGGKDLIFPPEEESYGINVLQVREIIRLTDITSVPQMPAYVRGVINLRGKIIPVIDLRTRFGFAAVKNTDVTCIVVFQVKMSDGKAALMGLIVDSVEEVTNIPAVDVEPTPDFGSKIETDYILGMAKVKGTVKTLLNVERVLTA